MLSFIINISSFSHLTAVLITTESLAVEHV